MSSLISAIITAAGSGTRYGKQKNKIFEKIGQKTVLEHSVSAFLSAGVRNIIITTSTDDESEVRQLSVGYDHVSVIRGGATRLESVQHGLRHIPHESTGVLIHDAARPNIQPDLIEAILSESRHSDAIIPGVPVVDTIKEVDGDILVVRTVPRARLIAVQTPQYFSKCHFLDLLSANPNDSSITDESYIIEQNRFPVKVIRGNPTNIKLTYYNDLNVLKSYMNES